MANRAYLMSLPLTTRGLIKPKPATWAERTFWGPRHRISLSFHEVRQRAVFPLYLEHRDRVVRLAEDPAQLLIDFATPTISRSTSCFPQSAKRQLSETLESTDTISLFLDRSEGLTPQVLSVQFGYFTGLQSWAPVLVPTLFFVLGNVAAVLVRNVAERLSKRWPAAWFGRPARPEVRQQGAVLDEDTLGGSAPARRLRRGPGLCGRDVEERSRGDGPGPPQSRLSRAGVGAAPTPGAGLLATVRHWDVEEHEVEIEPSGTSCGRPGARATLAPGVTGKPDRRRLSGCRSRAARGRPRAAGEEVQSSPPARVRATARRGRVASRSRPLITSDDSRESSVGVQRHVLAAREAVEVELESGPAAHELDPAVATRVVDPAVERPVHGRHWRHRLPRRHSRPGTRYTGHCQSPGAISRGTRLVVTPATGPGSRRQLRRRTS
jgi:hypothetical protein